MGIKTLQILLPIIIIIIINHRWLSNLHSQNQNQNHFCVRISQLGVGSWSEELLWNSGLKMKWLQRAPKSPEKNINALMGGESTMEVSIPLIMPRSHVRGAGLEKAPGCRLVSAPGRSEQPEKQRKNKQKSQSKWAELIRCFCLVNDSHCRANGVLTIGEEVIEEKGLTGFLTYKLSQDLFGHRDYCPMEDVKRVSRVDAPRRQRREPRDQTTVEWVRKRVVVVMEGVRELFSLAMSAICVRIRCHRSEVTRIVYHMAHFFVYCCILTTMDSKGQFPLYFAM